MPSGILALYISSLDSFINNSFWFKLNSGKVSHNLVATALASEFILNVSNFATTSIPSFF